MPARTLDSDGSADSSAESPAVAYQSVAEQMLAEDDDLFATRLAQESGHAQPWQLRLPDGRAFDLPAALVVGRNPVAPSTAPGALALPLDDPWRSVSKTHAMIELRDGIPWLTDLHSTNGTTLTNSAGEAQQCPPQAAVPVADGWRIGFGEFTVTVSREST